MRCGLANLRGKLGYQWHGGFGYGWLPDWAQHLIVRLWNPIGCYLYGHSYLDYALINEVPENYIVCTDCSRQWSH